MPLRCFVMVNRQIGWLTFAEVTGRQASAASLETSAAKISRSQGKPTVPAANSVEDHLPDMISITPLNGRDRVSYSCANIHSDDWGGE